MSYRELRNFCETMRGLGYTRLISMENFRKPNFELVADVLYWLAQRYDPNTNIPDDIDDEKSRVEFIKSVSTLFASKARIKLNPRKLYQADGYAVQELLKIASMLYKAYVSQGHDDEEGIDFSLPNKLSNLKSHKQLSTEITELGAKVFDLISKESDLKVHREKALSFLENISRNLESNNEQQYIEQCVRDIIAQQKESIVQMQKYVQNLTHDEKILQEKIQKRQLDLDRAEKRLKTLTNVKPAFMDDYERHERELQKLYDIYLEKFRNLEYLEHQLDLYNQQEQEKFLDSQKALKKMQKKIKDEEMKLLRGDQEIDESLLDAQIKEESLNSHGDSRNKISQDGNRKQNKRDNKQKYGSIQGGDDSEEDDGQDNGDEEDLSLGDDDGGEEEVDGNQSDDNF